MKRSIGNESQTRAERGAEVLERSLRRKIELDGTDSLEVTDLQESDLDNIEWSGGPTHPASVAKALERVSKGEVDYIAIRKDGKPISIGGVDYVPRNGKGTLWQLATMEELRSLGVGTKLINALENKIREHGLSEAVLSVEDNNPRAQALYSKLGYKVIGEDLESWEELDKDGNPYTYHAKVKVMSKKL